jgi:hypothetical protein
LLVDHAKFKMRLPASEGGAGLTSVLLTAAPAFVSSSCYAFDTILKTIEWRAYSEILRARGQLLPPSQALEHLDQAIKEINEKKKKDDPKKFQLPGSAKELVKMLASPAAKKTGVKPPSQAELLSQVRPRWKTYLAQLEAEEKQQRDEANKSSQDEKKCSTTRKHVGTKKVVNIESSDSECDEECGEVAEGSPFKKSFLESKALQAASLSAQQKWAMSPLTTTPSHSSLCLSTLAIRTFYKLVLGLQPTNHPTPPIPANCSCKPERLSKSQKILHLHFCRASSAKKLQVARHNSLASSVARIFQDVGVTVHREIPTRIRSREPVAVASASADAASSADASSASSVRISDFVPDLLLNFPLSNSPVIADVVVTCPIAPANVLQSAATAAVAAYRASEAKVRKYQDLAKEWNAISLPLAFETHGAFGPAISTLAELFTAHVHQNQLDHKFEFRSPYKFFMRAMSAALCTANATVVHGTSLLIASEAYHKAKK